MEEEKMWRYRMFIIQVIEASVEKVILGCSGQGVSGLVRKL